MLKERKGKGTSNSIQWQMGIPSAQVTVTEEQRDAAQLAKSKALHAISQGNLDQALDLLTEAILLNPHSAILYATRGIHIDISLSSTTKS